MKKCNALIKEIFKYQFSEDCNNSCLCSLTNLRCIAIEIADPENRSSQFFSRAKNIFNKNKAQYCPLYGQSEEKIKELMIEKIKKENDEKLSNIMK